MAGALALLLRNEESPTPEYQFETPSDIRDACREFREALQQSRVDCLDNKQPGSQSAEPEDDIQSAEPDDDDDWFIFNLDEYEEVEATPGAFEDEEADRNRHCDKTAPSARSAKTVKNYCPIVQPKLRQLLIAVFTQLPTREFNGKFYSVLIRYLALASLTKTGEWKASGVISHHVAVLLFVARLTMFSIIKLIGQGEDSNLPQ
jgi:hypothetical protein